jgi:hypothetical protein
LFVTVICGVASDVSVSDEIDSEHAKSQSIEIVVEDSRSTGCSALWQSDCLDSTGSGAWHVGRSVFETETISA